MKMKYHADKTCNLLIINMECWGGIVLWSAWIGRKEKQAANKRRISGQELSS